MNLSDFLTLARSYDGCNAGDHPGRYVQLLRHPGDDPAWAARYYASPKTSSCALTVLGLWRLAGVPHQLLLDAYRPGHATADVLEVARELGAYHTVYDVTAGRYEPKAGDAVMIVQPEHAFVIVAISKTESGWALESIDGGQTIRDERGVGQQGIELKDRNWSRRGSIIDDTPPGERTRQVACVIDTAKLLDAAATGTDPAPETEPAPDTEPGYILGVDVSQWQDPAAIDWETLARTHRFVIARATYGPRPDRTFVEHIRRARDAGLQVGGYHFLWQDAPAEQQLEAFRAQLDRADIGAGDIVPAVDLEDDGPRDFSIYEPRAKEFCRGMGEVLVYTGPDFYGRMGAPAWVLEYPLWVAHYTDAEQPSWPWAPWSIWQHTGTGRVDGYAKNIDCNRARSVPVRSASGTGYL